MLGGTGRTGKGEATYVAGERLILTLRAGTSVQVDDDLQPSVASPTGDLVEVLEAAPGVVLAAAVDEVLLDPEADGDADGVELEAGDLGYVVLGDPGGPVLLEGGVGLVLAQVLNTRPLVARRAAAHVAPRVRRHPRLHDELRAQVHAADRRAARLPPRPHRLRPRRDAGRAGRGRQKGEGEGAQHCGYDWQEEGWN